MDSRQLHEKQSFDQFRRQRRSLQGMNKAEAPYHLTKICHLLRRKVMELRLAGASTLAKLKAQVEEVAASKERPLCMTAFKAANLVLQSGTCWG